MKDCIKCALDQFFPTCDGINLTEDMKKSLAVFIANRFVAQCCDKVPTVIDLKASMIFWKELKDSRLPNKLIFQRLIIYPDCRLDVVFEQGVLHFDNNGHLMEVKNDRKS